MLGLLARIAGKIWQITETRGHVIERRKDFARSAADSSNAHEALTPAARSWLRRRSSRAQRAIALPLHHPDRRRTHYMCKTLSGHALARVHKRRQIARDNARSQGHTSCALHIAPNLDSPLNGLTRRHILSRISTDPRFARSHVMRERQTVKRCPPTDARRSRQAPGTYDRQ